jgi:predicted restriction endonuclease
MQKLYAWISIFQDIIEATSLTPDIQSYRTRIKNELEACTTIRDFLSTLDEYSSHDECFPIYQGLIALINKTK